MDHKNKLNDLMYKKSKVNCLPRQTIIPKK